jgi:hypothetical protein
VTAGSSKKNGKKGKKKMPRFDLANYETVEDRLKRFYAMAEDGRITTELVEDYGDKPKTWVVKASVYLTAGDQASGLPKATGYASEIDGTGGANNGSALENAETSAIGRALANLGMSGNKRASREEMSKVNRIAEMDYLAEAENTKSVDELRRLYTLAMANGAPAEVLGRLKDRASELDSGSEDSRTGRSNNRSQAKPAGK